MRARKEWLEWFRVDRDLPTHPKILRLAQAAGWSRHEAIGRLVEFWAWVARYAPYGTFTEAEAGAARSLGLPVDDLIASAFIERANSDSWRVRNWYDFNGKAIRERARKRRGDSEEKTSLPPTFSGPTGRDGTGRDDTERRSLEDSPPRATPAAPKGATFIRPTLAEVTAYCRERALAGFPAVKPQAWLDHYTANGWKVGKNAMKDWRASVRTWERNGHGNSNGPSAGGKLSARQIYELSQRMEAKS